MNAESKYYEWNYAAMDEKNLISFINYQDQYNNIRIFDGDKDIIR